MIAPFGYSVVCLVLVGRSAYLQSLYQAIDQARRGNGQTILISGEAGIGKSRLIDEAKTTANQQGFLILQGNCFQPDSAYPYAPLLDLLRLTLSVEQIKTDLQPWSTIIHELSRLLPDLDPLSALPDFPANTQPDQNKRRLSATLLSLFGHIAAKQPTLVIIEDIHWSDDNSLEFLQQLARWSAFHSVLLLATYRNDEIRPALQHWLAALDRTHLASELSLTRLNRMEVDEMPQAILKLRRPMREEFIEKIVSSQ